MGTGKFIFFKSSVLVGQPRPSRWPHTHEHMGSTNWAQWTTQTREDIKLGEGGEERWISKELRKEIWGEYDKINYEIIKEVIKVHFRKQLTMGMLGLCFQIMQPFLMSMS